MIPPISVMVTADTDAAEAELRRFGQTASNAMNQAETSGRKVTGLGRYLGGSTFKNQLQNAGYQFSDFGAQVSAGTSPFVALGQQLPQLLGGMGIFGAVAGAAVSFLPLVLGDAAKNAKDLREQFDDLADSAGTYSDFVEGATDDTEELAKKFGEAAEEARETFRILAENRRMALGQEARGLIGEAADPFGLGGTMRGLQAGVVADYFDLDRAFLAFTESARDARDAVDEVAERVISASNAMATARGTDAQIEAAREMLAAYTAAADMDGKRSQSEIEYIEALGETILKLQEIQKMDSDLAASLENVGTAASEASEVVSEGVEQVGATLGEGAVTLGQDGQVMGTQIVAGMSQGIQDQMPELLATIENMTAQATQAARDGLEIRSPSRVFQYFGQMIGKGLAVGIDDSAGEAVDSVENMNTEFLGKMGSMLGQYEKFAKAEAFVNAALAASRTLTTPGLDPFTRIAAAVSVLNAGKQFANSIGSGGGGGGGGAAAGASAAAAPAQSQGPLQVSLAGLNADQLYEGGGIGRLLDRLNDEAGDRGYRILGVA